MLEIKPKILETKTWKDIEDTIGDNDKFGWKYNSFSLEKGHVFYHFSIEKEITLNGNLGYYIIIRDDILDRTKWWKSGRYVCFTEIFDLQNIKDFFNYLMTEKLLYSKIPYSYVDVVTDDGDFNCDIISSNDFRGIPIDNFRVVVSDFFVGILKDFGFDFGKWYKEYNSIPENSIDDWKIPRKYKPFMKKFLEIR